MLKGHKADLKVENCQPSFHKPRQVPYALRPKVEEELTRLEKDGILSKVEYSEWATPIVPVVKRNGSVCVCGDFKVSVNPVLRVEQYPVPHIEDINFLLIWLGENILAKLICAKLIPKWK